MGAGEIPPGWQGITQLGYDGGLKNSVKNTSWQTMHIAKSVCAHDFRRHAV